MRRQITARHCIISIGVLLIKKIFAGAETGTNSKKRKRTGMRYIYDGEMIFTMAYYFYDVAPNL